MFNILVKYVSVQTKYSWGWWDVVQSESNLFWAEHERHMVVDAFKATNVNFIVALEEKSEIKTLFNSSLKLKGKEEFNSSVCPG